MSLRILLAATHTFLSICCFSQQLNFRSYTSAQGLSQNSIYCIAETSEGFMWFGTQDGINRFDGKNFLQVKAQIETRDTSSTQKQPRSKMVTALYGDKNDLLWLGTTRELLIYDRVLNKYLSPQTIFPHFKIVPNPWITHITEDNKENVWIATQSNELFCYNKQKKVMVSLHWQSGRPDKIIAIGTDGKKNFYVASDKDVYFYREGNFMPLQLHRRFPDLMDAPITEMKFINDQMWLILNAAEILLFDYEEDHVKEYIPFTKTFTGAGYLHEPRIIHQSDNNTAWVGSRSEGLLKINLPAHTFELSRSVSSGHNLKSQFVLSFYTSRLHITWIGLSGGGVAEYDPLKIQIGLWRIDQQTGQPLQDNMLLSVFSENNEDFYAGTLYGGLLHRNIIKNTARYYQPPLNDITAVGSRNIYEITSVGDRLLWMATWAGLYSFDRTTQKFNQYTNPEDPQTRELYAVIKLKKANKLLTGGAQGGLRLFNLATRQWEPCYDPAGFLSSHRLGVRYMREVENGDIYMSTEEQNLVKYNYKTGLFTTYPALQHISGTSRYFLFEGPYLWVATDDGLIQVLASGMQILKLWNTGNVLPNDYIYAVLPGDRNHLWISCNAGLVLLDYKIGICEKFTEKDGLQSMEFNTASCYKDKKGRCWFGGINGLNMVDERQTLSPRYSIKPLIVNITVMNKPYAADTATPYLHTISLPYAQNFIGFEFQSPGYSPDENITYEYMLKGVDSGWINNSIRNYANYTQLPPGKYIFSVRTYLPNEWIGSDDATIQIIITPPWFKTWWFYLLLTISVISLIYGFLRYRISHARNVERLRQHISADLHDDIGASLTSISILAQLSQQEKVDMSIRRQYLQKIYEQTTAVTNALRDIVWSINPQNDKLEIILARMKRYAAELLEAKNINYSFKTNVKPGDEIANASIRHSLYLIFKESVNNLSKYSMATQVTISLQKEYKCVILEINDNGQGFDPGFVTKGNGIENMQQRAKLMNALFTLSSTPGKGTCIKVIVSV